MNKNFIQQIRRSFVVLLLCFSLLPAASAQTQRQPRLTLKLQQVCMEQALNEIEKRISSYFIVNKGVDIGRIVSIDAVDQSLSAVLDQLIEGTNYTYKINTANIMLSVRSPESTNSSKVRIEGTVSDNKGQPIVGAAVVVKGTTLGTSTDVDGKFTLTLPVPTDETVLSANYLGYEPAEVPVGTRSEIRIVLKESTVGIADVVVVGYGTQRKVNVTGAVSQITTEELKDRPVTSMSQALQGVVPNLNVTFGSGQPGTGGSLNIRGTTSINGGSPLVLIDGVPGNIDRINVNDVESISVLKDASASAVYGARAAFGVILVTTKSAKEGKISVHYQNNFAWTTHATSTDYITEGYTNARINDNAFFMAQGAHLFRYTAEDWAEMEARIHDKTENPERPWVVVKPHNGRDRYNYYGNFDWFNYFYSKWRPKQSHDLSISGSSEKIRYLLSGGYSREQGIFRVAPDVNKRYNFRVKVDADITPWLTVSSNTRYCKSDYSWKGFNQAFTPSSDNLIGSGDAQFYVPYYHYHPQYVPFNPDGTLTGNSEMSNYTMGFGLHAIQENGQSKGSQKYSEFSSTFQVVLKPAKGLMLTGNYTYTHDLFERYYRSTKVQYSLYPGQLSDWNWAALNTDQLTERMYTNNLQVFNAFANYDATWGRHGLKLMAGFNQELLQYKNIKASGTNLLSQTLNDLNLATGETPVIGGGASEYALRGAFWRINYDFDGKYLAEISGRYDGTSRFPKNSRFAVFPSFSLGYRISEESYFEPLRKVIDNLKIRYSYGTLGNQEVATYAYIASMASANSSWLDNGQYIKQVSAPAAVAKNLTWESATTNNIGVDLDMFNNRLSFVFDYYTRDTKDMLTQGRKLPAVFGTGEPKENAADLRTTGYEISLSWRDQFKAGRHPFHYGLSFILAAATSKITKFDNPAGLLSSHRVGEEIGELWGYVYDGFFQTDEEAAEYTSRVKYGNVAQFGNAGGYKAGDIRIRDVDGNGYINEGANTVSNPGDKVKLGNSTPRYSYGITLTASWNGIDLYMLFQGIGSKDWYPPGETTLFWGPYSRPYASFIPRDFMDKVWSPENPDAYFPRLIGYRHGQDLGHINSMYLQDVGYCKLRNITLGYTLPDKWMRKIGISKFRIYASGENLFTWSKLESDYIDPEETMVYSDARTYPMGRTISFGIELSF